METLPKTIPKDFTSYFDNLCEREKPLIWVSTISKDAGPHLVPTCFVKPLTETKIAIGCVFIRQTVKNVIANQKIALASVRLSENGYDGYMVKGRARVFDSGREFGNLQKTIYDSTKGRRMIKWMILVSVESVYSLKPGEGKKRMV